MPHLTPEFLPGLPIFTRRFFEELFTRIKAPAAIVLDNFQTLPSDAPVQELLSLGLGEQPEHIRVFVVSRSDPPPAFAKLQADQKIRFVKDDVLRFTWQETTTLVSLKPEARSSSPLPPTLHQIFDQTEGWVAGLVLSLEHGQERFGIAEEPTWQTPEVVFEYLAAEVFKALPGDAQELLRNTAFAPFISVPLACRLSKNPQAGRLLADLYRRRYFIERRREAPLTYQYHPLFKIFLQKMAERAYPEFGLRQLKLATGLGLVEEDQKEEAAELFVAEQASEQLSQVVMQEAKSLLLQGRTGVLQRWIEALPADMVQEDPWLLYWLAQCKRVGSLSESENLFIQAFEGFRSSGDQIGMVRAGTAIIECITWAWSDWSKLDRWFEILHPIAQDVRTYPNLETEIQITLALCLALLWRNPKSPKLSFWLDRHSSLMRKSPELFALSPLNHMFISQYIVRGETEKARANFVLMQNTSLTPTLPAISKLATYFGEAHLAWFSGDRAHCDKAVAEGIAFGQKTGCIVMEFQIRAQSVYGALLEYDTATAEKCLEPYRQYLENDSGGLGAHFNFLQGWVLELQGRFKDSLKYLERSSNYLVNKDRNFPEGLLLAHKATVFQCLMRGKEAPALFPRMYEISKKTESLLLDYIGKLTEADVLISQGKQNLGKKLLQKGFSIGRIQGFKYHSWWPKEVLTKLCTNALEWDIETDYVQSVIRQYRLVPKESTAPPLSWPWALKIHTFGRFTIEIEGTPLTAARKIPRRTLLFLKALIAFGGREVAETDISDALWPDADGDMAHQAFATTLHRVRKLLGQPNLIHQQDKKLTLNAHWCWVDAWGIESLSGKAQSSIQGEDKQSEEETLKRLVALYQGPFLSDDIHEPWTAPMRERLRRKYLTALETLCTTWSQEGRKAKAKACLERAMEYEPAAGDIYDVFFGKG